MNYFEDNYKKLNKEQKQAVDTIEGPVLVLAGPGTGKTQILTLRIANIINQTDTAAENILALTFTENAAQNMRKRLVSFIGNEGYKTNINTFHGFCNEVIQTFPEKFAFNRELKQMSDLDKYKAIKQILDNYDTDNVYRQFSDNIIDKADGNFLKPTNAPYLFVNDIIKTVDNLNREFVTNERFTELIKEEIDELAGIEKINKKTNKPYGKWTNRNKLICKNIELLYIKSEFESYKKTNFMYDFTDMITNVVTKLKTDDELLAHYQEKYLYVLVDEFQDTNGAQNELLKTLLSWHESPNIFAVGDDDQSIFKFQGANLDNILEFQKSFKNTKTIVLKTNYRSNQEILDSSAKLISKNSNRIESKIEKVDKNLTAFFNFENKNSIQINKTPSEEYEIHQITKEIKNLIEDGVEPKEIGIIFRRHSDSLNLIDNLEAEDIQYETVVGVNLLETPIFEFIETLINCINKPFIDSNLATTLLSDFIDFSKLDIYKLLQHLHYKRKPKPNLFDVITDIEGLNKLKLIDSMSLSNFADKILSLKQNSETLHFFQFFEKVIFTFNIVDSLKRKKDNENLILLKQIFNFIKALSKASDYKINHFLRDIETIHENKINVNAADRTGESDKKIKILTAHASKGLEFEYVFIPKVIDKTWGNSRSFDKIKLIDIYENDFVEDKNEEARRLFFVALTRAKKELKISFSDKYIDGNDYKPAMPSIFISEIEDQEIVLNDIEEKDFDKIEIFGAKVTKPNINLSDTQEEYIQSLVDKFKLSATSLNSYLEDPEKFFYNHLLKVPQDVNKFLALGIAVHYALENYFRAPNKGLDYLLSRFESSLYSEFGYHDEFETTLNQGKKLLESWQNLYSETNETLALEYSFYGHNVMLSDIQLVGKIDKIEKIDGNNNVKVIDYKTGSAKSKGQIIKPLTGGIESNYYRQMVFYNLMCKLDPFFKYNILATEIQFIKPKNDKLVNISVEIEDSEVEDLKQIIYEVMGKIRNLEFN